MNEYFYYFLMFLIMAASGAGCYFFFIDTSKDLICQGWGGEYYQAIDKCVNLTAVGYCTIDGKLYKGNSINKDFIINVSVG